MHERFRKIYYLSNRELKKTAKTVTREPLDENIVQFCSKAGDNRGKYIEFVVAHNSGAGKQKTCSGKATLQPIFITIEKREMNFQKVENKTVQELEYIIGDTICTIADMTAMHAWLELWENYKAACYKGRIS